MNTNTPEPSEKATIQDVVNNTPKGQAAVQRALENSAKDMNTISEAARATDPISKCCEARVFRYSSYYICEKCLNKCAVFCPALHSDLHSHSLSVTDHRTAKERIAALKNQLNKKDVK